MARVPEAGDVVRPRFTPQAGHRPAVVLDPTACDRIGPMPCCPVTTRIEESPFEVALAGAPPSAA